MTGFVGRLRATLGLDSAEFSNKLRGARQEAQGFAASVSQGLRGLTGPALGLTALAATATAGAVQVRNIMRDIALIGNEAQRSGLSVEAFQEWSHVAAQARVPIDALTDGFKEMALRADEFIVTGSGPAAEAFARLGFGADDLARRLQDPSELFTEIVRRLGRLDRAARIRIADEIFGGTGGERFLGLIDRGADSLDEARQRARDLGLVLDEQVIARATILDQKFQELTTRVQRFFQAAAVGLFAGGVESPADTLERIYGSLERARDALGEDMFSAIVAQTGELGEEAERAAERISRGAQLISGEVRRIANEYEYLAYHLDRADQGEAADAFARIRQSLVDLRNEFDASEISQEEFLARISASVRETDELISGLGDIDVARFDGVKAELNSFGELVRSIAGAVRQLAVEAGSLPDNMDTGNPLDPNGPILPGDVDMPRSPRPRRAPSEGALDRTSSGSRGGGSSETYAAMIADIRARTEALQAEAEALTQVAASGVDYGDAVEYARIRAELLTQAQEEGRAITPKLTAEIDAAAAAYATQTEAVDDLTDALERQREAGERGAQALSDVFMAALEGGDAGRNAVARLIMEIARMEAMRGFQALGGTSLGGGIFRFIGSLLGKNARGTASWRGGMSVVGEEGPEIVDLPTGARVTPALESARILRDGASAGGGRLEIGFDATMQAFVATMRDETGRVVDRKFQVIGPEIVRQSVSAAYQANERKPFK